MTEPVDVQVYTHAIAKRIREGEGALTATVTATIVSGIDRLDEDPMLFEMLEASVHANITTILHLLINKIPIEHLEPTTAAVEYARRLAQRDVPSNSLVRAYHIGQSVMLGELYSTVAELNLPTAVSMEVTRHVSEIVYRYIDWISTYVFAAYADEQRRWMGVESHVLTSAIHAILDTTTADPARFERDIRYRLDQQHVALVLWAADDAVTVRELDRTVRTLATSLNSNGDPLVTAIDRSTVWVWLPVGRRTEPIKPTEVDAILGPNARVRATVGLPGAGVAGFRRSHQQARAAFSVATVPGPSGRVVGYGDRGVAVVALLAQDLAATRAWVRDVLGGLAAPGEGPAVLRETLSMYYATGDSHVRAAELLNIHRNTVKYRVTRALAETAVSHRLDLALALTVCEFLGPAVLGPPPNTAAPGD